MVSLVLYKYCVATLKIHDGQGQPTPNLIRALSLWETDQFPPFPIRITNQISEPGQWASLAIPSERARLLSFLPAWRIMDEWMNCKSVTTHTIYAHCMCEITASPHSISPLPAWRTYQRPSPSKGSLRPIGSLAPNPDYDVAATLGASSQSHASVASHLLEECPLCCVLCVVPRRLAPAYAVCAQTMRSFALKRADRPACLLN
jgi:hypothetical protein